MFGMKTVAAALVATVAAYPVAAETNWPQTAGVYLQMHGGSHVQLPDIKNHPTRNYMAFTRDLLNDLPQVQIDEIEAVILQGVKHLEEDGKLDVQWTFLVDRHLDPQNTYAQSDGTDLAVSNWRWLGRDFNIEYGPRHSWANYQVALYPKDRGGNFLATRTGVTGGSDSTAIPIEAIYVRGSCCLAGWAFIPVTME